MKKIILMVFCIGLTYSIDQVCQNSDDCPSNSQCLSTNYCGCDNGFIGSCNSKVIIIDDSKTNVSLTANSNTLFQVHPNDLNNYIQFAFDVCLNNSETLTFNLWGQTGTITTFDNTNTLLSSTTRTLTAGCTTLTTPYISFGLQPNGQDDSLIFGIQNNQDTAISIQIAVSQKVVIGVRLYYYILFGLIAITVVGIIIGTAMFIRKQVLRRRNGGGQRATLEPEYNDIEHFEKLMPMIQADKLGKQLSVCAICLQQIEGAQVIRQTMCKHLFHSACIDSWGMKSLTCPVCRAELTEKGLTVNNRLRNSTIRMSLPPEQDWQQLPQIQQHTQRQAESESHEIPLQQKKQVRERML